MKTTLLIALLAVGMLLRPQPIMDLQNNQTSGGAVAVAASQQTPPRLLNTAEMNSTVGSGIAGCYESKAANGDTYITCCVDLWIFAVCVAVDWTAIKSLIPIL